MFFKESQQISWILGHDDSHTITKIRLQEKKTALCFMAHYVQLVSDMRELKIPKLENKELKKPDHNVNTFLLICQKQYLPGNLKYLECCVNYWCFHLTEKAGVIQNWSIKISKLKLLVTRPCVQSRNVLMILYMAKIRVQYIKLDPDLPIYFRIRSAFSSQSI